MHLTIILQFYLYKIKEVGLSSFCLLQCTNIDDMQFGVVKGKGTTSKIDAREVSNLKKRSSILPLWIWKKLLIGFREK